jgi:hypothetical protein
MRQLHAGPYANQKGILQEQAQPAQRVANGGLRQPQANGGPVHGRLGQKRFQDAKQVEIEIFDNHAANVILSGPALE